MTVRPRADGLFVSGRERRAAPRVVYRRTGEYDAASEIAVEPDGTFQAEAGGYVTHGRRAGRLSRRDHAELIRLAAALGPPVSGGTWAADGPLAELVVGDARFTWQTQAPTPEVEALVRFLGAR